MGAQLRRRRAQRGQALIEFGILMLIALIVLMGGVELGMAMLNSSVLRDAVQEGAHGWGERICTRGSDYYLRERDGSCAQSAALLICPDAALGSAGYYVPSPDCATPLATPYEFGVDKAVDPTGLAVMANCATTNSAGDCIEPDNGLPTLVLTAPDWLPFNPYPVDVGNCVTAAGALRYDGCVERIFRGFCTRAQRLSATPPDGCTSTTPYMPGLPPLNQQLYSLYQLRCYDDAFAERPCADVAVTRHLLRLPGRLDDASLLTTLANVCFDLQCASVPVVRGAHQLEAAPNWPVFEFDPLEMEIRVRYRHQFYSVLGGGLSRDSSVALDASVLAELDLGPLDADGLPQGGPGSEATSIKSAGTGERAYFKMPWKTFRRCFRINGADTGSTRVLEC